MNGIYAIAITIPMIMFIYFYAISNKSSKRINIVNYILFIIGLLSWFYIIKLSMYTINKNIINDNINYEQSSYASEIYEDDNIKIVIIDK